jgi:hypothetical protein
MNWMIFILFWEGFMMGQKIRRDLYERLNLIFSWLFISLQKLPNKFSEHEVRG